MIVQIYEVQNPIEARNLAKLGIDNMGVLTGKGNNPRELSFEQAKEIFKSLQKEKGVALSLSHDLQQIFELIKKTNPNILHLGARPDEITVADVKKIKNQFPELKIMRTIPVVNEESIELAKSYENEVEYLLLDTYEKNNLYIGATGEPHDWHISRKIVASVRIPVILAGGLGPDNVVDAIRKVRPAGVDSKTKTDSADGKSKDLDKVRNFVRIAKETF